MYIHPHTKIVWDSDLDDTGFRIQHITMSKRERSLILSRKVEKIEFLHSLMQNGQLPPTGCNCVSCRNGWDCCGNLFLMYHKVKFWRKGVQILSRIGRNI